MSLLLEMVQNIWSALRRINVHATSIHVLGASINMTCFTDYIRNLSSGLIWVKL